MDRQYSESVSAELSYLAQLFEEYAAGHSKIANRLRHGSQSSSEARLSQAFAFLMARTQRRIDAEYPAVVKPLVDLVGMPGPASIPSLATVEFQLRRDQPPDATGAVIPRGTLLRSESVGGVAPQFKTCRDVALWPIELTSASLELPPFQSSAASSATCAIRLKLRTPASQMAFDELTVDCLQFFIDAERDDAFRFHDALFADILEVEIRGGNWQPVRLGADALRSVGFSDAEQLFPGGKRDGAHLVVEFLAFPEKFLYFELSGLQEALRYAHGTEMEIDIYLNSEKEWAPRRLLPGGIRLFCSPAVNLFEQQTTPLEVKSLSDRVALGVDADSPEAFEIHSIHRVFVRDADDEEYEIPRFHRLQRGATGMSTEICWEYDDLEHTTVTRRHPKVALRFVDEEFNPRKIEDSVVYASVMCSNGELPSQLSSGEEGPLLQADSLSLVSECRCLRPPTRLRRLALARSTWDRVSHILPDPLTLNTSDGATPLRSALQTLACDDDALLQALLNSLVDIYIERTAGIVDGCMMCHGIEITLVFARSRQGPRGHLLLAEILQYFLANYVTRGVFFRLRAVYEDGRELRQWPTRSGGRSVI